MKKGLGIYTVEVWGSKCNFLKGGGVERYILYEGEAVLGAT